MLGDKFLGLPYTFAGNVNFEGKEAITIPSNIIICEIRATADACDTLFVLRVATDNNNEMFLRSFGQDIWNIRVTKIFRLGTSKVVRDRIEVYGYTKREIDEY